MNRTYSFVGTPEIDRIISEFSDSSCEELTLSEVLRTIILRYAVLDKENLRLCDKIASLKQLTESYDNDAIQQSRQITMRDNEIESLKEKIVHLHEENYQLTRKMHAHVDFLLNYLLTQG